MFIITKNFAILLHTPLHLRLFLSFIYRWILLTINIIFQLDPSLCAGSFFRNVMFCGIILYLWHTRTVLMSEKLVATVFFWFSVYFHQAHSLKVDLKNKSVHFMNIYSIYGKFRLLRHCLSSQCWLVNLLWLLPIIQTIYVYLRIIPSYMLQ